MRADELLVAIGRRLNTDELGLDTVGLEPGKPIEVDDSMRANDWLYAIGDVNGRALLTHMGKYQARIAADVILGHEAGCIPANADGSRSPRVIFTDPHVAAVGYTLDAAQQDGLNVRAVDVPDPGQRGGELLRARRRARHRAARRGRRPRPDRRARPSPARRSPSSCTPRRSPSSARCRSSGCSTPCRRSPRAARCGSTCSRRSGSPARVGGRRAPEGGSSARGGVGGARPAGGGAGGPGGPVASRARSGGRSSRRSEACAGSGGAVRPELLLRLSCPPLWRARARVASGFSPNPSLILL